MTSEIETESSLSTEPDNLTALHEKSGLPIEHQSRRLESGFLIRASRLPRCVPLPATTLASRSWIWLHGEQLGRLNDENIPIRHWLCRICYHDDVSHPLSSYLLNVEKKTNKALNHLVLIHHYDKNGNKLLPNGSKKRKAESLDSWALQVTTNNTIFDVDGWKYCFIRWLVTSGVSLRQACSKEHKELLCFMNPRIKDLVPTSHGTVANWLADEVAKHKPKVIRSIANAKGKVTISFDGWKANNDVLDLLGVVVHYLRDDYKLHNVVLALSNTLGSHTGANIADQLFDVLKDYQISGNQIAYFAADNATNNDKALKVLSERVTLDPIKSRLRCAGHILNLVCTAILFGVDSEALEDAEHDFSQPQDDSSGTQEVTDFDNILNNGSEEQQHRAWQRKGPIGKLHNLVLHIKENNARIAIFESKQAQIIAENKTDESPHQRILRLVTNGGIRWNSTYLMIERAVFLRGALTLYQDHEYASINKDDVLNRDD